MTQYSLAKQAALLKWINTFKTSRRAATLKDLQDGLMLGDILEDMTSGDFSSSSLIRTPSSPEDNKANLETVSRGLAAFMRNDLPQYAPPPSKLRAILEHPDDNAICEFLSYFVITICLGSTNKAYVPAILKLDSVTQKEIANTVEVFQKQKQIDADPKLQEPREVDGQDAADLHIARDPALMEEELGQIKGAYDFVKKQNADLQARVDKLLDTRQALLNDLNGAQAELNAMKRHRGADAGAAIKDLRDEIKDKMAIIDDLEAQLVKETAHITKLEKDNAALKARADRVKDLEDKLTELEHENKQQQQQIKGLENYKKKAQDLTFIQQRNRTLEEQIVQMEQDLKDYENFKAQNRKLQKEIEEKVKVLANNEQEIVYTLQSRNVLQETNEELQRRVEYLESKHQADENMIKELQEQLQMGGAIHETSGSESPVTNGGFNLEHELETEPAVRLELQRLKAENTVLRSNMTVASENERLRSELESANKKVDLYRGKCTEAMEKHAVAQEQLNAIMNNTAGERLVGELDSGWELQDQNSLTPEYISNPAFVNLRKQFLDTSSDVENLTKRVQELEQNVADKERELIAVKTDRESRRLCAENANARLADILHIVSVIGEEQSAALTALKASDELIAESLQKELEATRKQLREKTFELDEMKAQLMEALVSKDKFRKQLDDAIASGGDPNKSRKEDVEKMEKLKAALRQKIEVSNDPSPSPTPPYLASRGDTIRLLSDPSPIASEFVFDEDGEWVIVPKPIPSEGSWLSGLEKTSACLSSILRRLKTEIPTLGDW